MVWPDRNSSCKGIAPRAPRPVYVRATNQLPVHEGATKRRIGQNRNGVPGLRPSYSAQLPAAQSSANKAAAISEEWRVINVGDCNNVSPVEVRHSVGVAPIDGIVAMCTQ